jgi:hypothetical protein
MWNKRGKKRIYMIGMGSFVTLTQVGGGKREREREKHMVCNITEEIIKYRKR